LQERVSLLMRIPACHIIHVHPDGAWPHFNICKGHFYTRSHSQVLEADIFQPLKSTSSFFLFNTFSKSEVFKRPKRINISWSILHFIIKSFKLYCKCHISLFSARFTDDFSEFNL
jgi:hypothetical protein